MDCLLGTNRHLFRNVSARYLQHNSDIYIILGYLHITTLREHSQYLRRRMRITFLPPEDSNKGGSDLCGALPGGDKSDGTIVKGGCMDLGDHMEAH